MVAATFFVASPGSPFRKITASCSLKPFISFRPLIVTEPVIVSARTEASAIRIAVRRSFIAVSVRLADLHIVTAHLAGVLELAGLEEVQHRIPAVRTFHALERRVRDDARLAGGVRDFDPRDLAFGARDGLGRL